MAVLRAVYNGSRSIRWGVWPPLGNPFAATFCIDELELMVFGGSIGVVEIGRLKAVGSISVGILSRAWCGPYRATMN